MDGITRELDYFTLGGGTGGNQQWFGDPVMAIGGSALVTACDLNIYLALRTGRRSLYPFDFSVFSAKEYVKFAKVMKDYIKPKLSVLDDIEAYVEGLKRYWMEHGGYGLGAYAVPGSAGADVAAGAMISQIDKGLPVPILLMKHRDKGFDKFMKTWFMIIGYNIIRNRFWGRAVLRGKAYWVDMIALWNTGLEPKGGLVVAEIE